MHDSADSRWPRRCPGFERNAAFVSPLILGIILFILFSILPSKLSFHDALNLPPQKAALDRRAVIKDTFRWAWDGYYTIAFPHDELKPATNVPGYSRNDWGATAVDALGTAILMEDADVVEIVLEHISKLDYSRTESSISVFETTIRYMGGMLSAYDLLAGPFSHLVRNQTAMDELLVQSGRLGEILSRAFIPGHVLPHPALTPNAETVEDVTNSVAGAGTLVLEWTRLSDLSRNQKFANLSQRAEMFLLDPKPKISEPLPGLVGTKLNVTTGEFLDTKGGWGGSGDSFYEYLLKMYIYDKNSFTLYRDRWVLAADSTMAHLASGSLDHPEITWLGKFDGNLKIPESGHMECFAGGNFLLAGMVLEDQKYTDFGLKLVEGCRYQYNSTTTQIGPEAFRWTPAECSNPDITSRWDCNYIPDHGDTKAENDRVGFWIVEPSYNLRPEVIESYYYAYRMTQDSKYQDWAWEAFLAINKTARMEHGFNYLRDVREPDGLRNQGNNQESYFFSETLKYLWLIFDDEDGKGKGEWHVNADFKKEDKWVYNTEGHPLRIR